MRDDVMDRVAPFELPLPAEPASVGLARRYFGSVAADAGLPEDVRCAGAFAVSELVTNAVQHGRAPITLRVTAMPRTLRVAVTDGSNRPPKLRSRARTRPLASDRRSGNHGRGLAIVETVADRWGCAPSVQSPGKTVWCDLSVGPTRGVTPEHGGVRAQLHADREPGSVEHRRPARPDRRRARLPSTSRCTVPASPTTTCVPG